MAVSVLNGPSLAWWAVRAADSRSRRGKTHHQRSQCGKPHANDHNPGHWTQCVFLALATLFIFLTATTGTGIVTSYFATAHRVTSSIRLPALHSQPQTSPREERNPPEPHHRSKTVPKKSQYTSRRWSHLPTTTTRRQPWLTTRSASAPLGFLPSSIAGSSTLSNLGASSNFHDQSLSCNFDRVFQ